MLPDLDGIYGTTCSTAEWQKRLARLLPALPDLLLRTVRDATWTWVATCRQSNRSYVLLSTVGNRNSQRTLKHARLLNGDRTWTNKKSNTPSSTFTTGLRVGWENGKGSIKSTKGVCCIRHFVFHGCEFESKICCIIILQAGPSSRVV